MTLSFLDRTRFRVGEEVAFEIRIQNTGKKTLAIPWTPHLADLEPGNSVASHTYLSGVVALAFTDSKGRQEQVNELLYGERNVAGTLRQLRPGEWFSLKGRKRIQLYNADWGGPQFHDSGFVNATATQQPSWKT